MEIEHLRKVERKGRGDFGASEINHLSRWVEDEETIQDETYCSLLRLYRPLWIQLEMLNESSSRQTSSLNSNITLDSEESEVNQENALLYLQSLGKKAREYQEEWFRQQETAGEENNRV